MNRSTKARRKIRITPSHLILGLLMATIGTFTAYASANTYEIVSGKDIQYSPTIETVKLTNSAEYNKTLIDRYSTVYNDGVFGIPKIIKFSESRQHVDIAAGSLQNGEWKARKGLAHTFTTADSRQKIFGDAIIYLRYNTPTTQHLGAVLVDDVINIVTSDGWQLGYKVAQIAGDPSQLGGNESQSVSQVVVIMIDDHTQSINSFRAELEKLGGRT